MPPLTRWYIKLALCYFIVALAGGVWQAAGGPLWLMPVTIHLLVVGWLTGTIFGVAYWMFPKYSKASPRGPDAVAVTTFVLLQMGMVLRVIAEPATIRALLLASALSQWLAAVGFAASIWPRVKAR
jgi:hypothetical protein